MVSRGNLSMLLLPMLSAIFVQLVATMSYDPSKVSQERFGWKTKRQSSGTNNTPQVVSPCPDVLLNVRDNRENRWQGIISAIPEEDATGAAFTIQLDKRADLIGTSFGEVSTADNIIHTIRDDSLTVVSGQKILVQFFVKYDKAAGRPPNVLTIRFNGRQICPTGEEETVPPTTPTRETTTPPPPSTSLPPLPPIIPASPITPTSQVAVLPAIPTRAPPRSSRGQSNEFATGVQLYEVNGEFKVKSNATLLILLVARPPSQTQGENTIETQTDDLNDLLAQVFNVSQATADGTGASESARPQPLNNRNDETGDDFEDEPPPFTSNREPAAAPSSPPARAPASPGGTDGQGGRSAGPPPWASPCSGVFDYLPNSAKGDTWYGELRLTSEEDLVGVRLDVELDKPARILGAWLGEVTSVDSTHYTIWNSSAEINSGETINVRIFAKYERDEAEPPMVRSIRLNGKQICPARSGLS